MTTSKMPARFRVKYIKVFVLYLFIPLCVGTSVFCSYACFWYFDLFRFICCPWLFGQHLGNNRFSGNTFWHNTGKIENLYRIWRFGYISVQIFFLCMEILPRKTQILLLKVVLLSVKRADTLLCRTRHCSTIAYPWALKGCMPWLLPVLIIP